MIMLKYRASLHFIRCKSLKLLLLYSSICRVIEWVEVSTNIYVLMPRTQHINLYIRNDKKNWRKSMLCAGLQPFYVLTISDYHQLNIKALTILLTLRIRWRCDWFWDKGFDWNSSVRSGLSWPIHDFIRIETVADFWFFKWCYLRATYRVEHISNEKP